MLDFSHYILNASAIIFLVDPLTIPGIVSSLPAHLRPEPGAEGLQKTADVLNRIIQTFEQAQKVNLGETLDIPVAITISKSDLLKFIIKHESTHLLLDDATYGNRLDTRAFEMINREVQD